MGRRFDRSDRWGRDCVTEARAARAATAPASPTLPPSCRSLPPRADRHDRHRPGKVDEILVVEAQPLAGNPEGMPTGSHRVRTAIRWVTTVAVIVVAVCAARAAYATNERS